MEETQTILVVTHERALRDRVIASCASAGYRTVGAHNGRRALEAARRERPALIVLDLFLPHNEGGEVCRLLRQELTAPILILTTPEGERETVHGLEMGADVYVAKPVARRVLLAQVKALLRRTEIDARVRTALPNPQVEGEVTFGDLTLDHSGHRLRRGEREIPLTLKEYELLSTLVAHEGHILPRAFLRERIWGSEQAPENRTLDVHIRWLRKKIEQNPDAPRHIVTVSGIGYRFERALGLADARSQGERLRAAAAPLEGWAPEAAGRALRGAFAALPDARSPHGRHYPLPSMLALLVAATLAGADRPQAIALWGQRQSPESVRALGFTEGRMPGHTVVTGVLRSLDMTAVEDSIGQWLREQRAGVEVHDDQDRRHDPSWMEKSNAAEAGVA